jgi:urea transport system substrate-binding protein
VTGVGRREDGLPIGVITSLTGGNAATETSIHRGALLAIEEVNAAGGVLAGRPLVPIVEDYGSDISQAPVRARRLLDEAGVRVCVGGYTSASRVAMAPAFRNAGALLLYPTYFEGLELDGHTIYCGAVPNQFLIDYMDWVFSTLGRRIYMIGSDYVYPRTAGMLVRRLAAQAGATVVADRYAPLGATDFSTAIAEIAALGPDVIVSNVVGSDSVPAFYRAVRHAGHSAGTLPIAATVTTEVEVQAMGAEYAAGHYMAATYFGTLDNAANARYVSSFRARFGADAVTHVDQVAAYNAVWLFARALERAEDLSFEALRAAFVGARFDGSPEGVPITVLPNQHTVHGCYIGRVREDGQFEVLRVMAPRLPDPYPRQLVPADRRPPSLVE